MKKNDDENQMTMNDTFFQKKVTFDEKWRRKPNDDEKKMKIKKWRWNQNDDEYKKWRYDEKKMTMKKCYKWSPDHDKLVEGEDMKNMC